MNDDQNPYEHLESHVADRVDELLDELSNTDADVILAVAEGYGWDADDYLTLCRYDLKDRAWYPQDGSCVSIVDHAMSHIDEHVTKAVRSVEDLRQLESNLRRAIATVHRPGNTRTAEQAEQSG